MRDDEVCFVWVRVLGVLTSKMRGVYPTVFEVAMVRRDE